MPLLLCTATPLAQGGYYTMLSGITADTTVDQGVRQLAALNLKNGLEAKVRNQAFDSSDTCSPAPRPLHCHSPPCCAQNPAIAYEKGQRWLAVPEANRLTIKTNVRACGVSLPTLTGAAAY